MRRLLLLSHSVSRLRLDFSRDPAVSQLNHSISWLLLDAVHHLHSEPHERLSCGTIR